MHRRHVLGRTDGCICRLCKRMRIVGPRQVIKLQEGGRLVLGWRDGQLLRCGTREVGVE
jgi:hypothetical protein